MIGIDGKPRELHIEKGLKCSKPGAGSFPYSQFPIHEETNGNTSQCLVNEHYFKLEQITLKTSYPFECSLQQRAKLITNIGIHDVHILHGDSLEILPRAHSAFLPAGLENVRIVSPDSKGLILIASEHAS